MPVLPGSKEDRLLILALILTGVALRVWEAAEARGTLLDDAYIALRHGRNFFLARGLTFNPGEHVLGTFPLYAVFLGIIWRGTTVLFGESGERIGYWISAVNIALMAWLARLLVKIVPTGTYLFSRLPLAVFCLYLPFVDNTTTGMETTLFLTLMALSFLLLRSGREVAASIVLGSVMLVRAEGALWALGALLYAGINRRLTRRLLIPLTVIGLCWLASATSYYGEPVPQNVLAKSGWLLPQNVMPTRAWSPGTWDLAGTLRQGVGVLRTFTLAPYGVPAWGKGALHVVTGAWLIFSLLVFALGAAKLWKNRRPEFLWGLFFALSVTFYIVGRGALWPSWYALPPGLAFVIVLSYGAEALAGAPALARIRWDDRRFVYAVLVTLSVAMAGSSAILWKQMRYPFYRRLQTSTAPTGRYLAETAGADDEVLVTEIGYIGYLTDCYILDPAALVSREIMTLKHENPLMDEQGLVERFTPTFVVVRRGDRRRYASGDFGSWFETEYDLVFETPSLRTYRRKREAAAGDAGPQD